MKKILVVDDVYDIRVMLHEFLTLKNFDVKTADDGLEALKIMDDFIKNNSSKFNSDKLVFSSKLKK